MPAIIVEQGIWRGQRDPRHPGLSELYGNPPPAYLLEVRGERFELGESLSSAAASNLEASLGLLKILCSSTNPPEWEPFVNHEQALP